MVIRYCLKIYYVAPVFQRDQDAASICKLTIRKLSIRKPTIRKPTTHELSIRKLTTRKPTICKPRICERMKPNLTKPTRPLLPFRGA